MKSRLDECVEEYMQYCKEVLESGGDPTSFEGYMTDGIDHDEPLYHNAHALLRACEAIAHGMRETQGFIPNFLEQAIKNARGK